VPFEVSDLTVSRLAVRPNDLVTFALATRTADPSQKRATQISILPKNATVVTDAGKLVLRLIKEDSTSRGGELFTFAPKDVADGVQLNEGDQVVFGEVQASGHEIRRSAKSVRRTREAPAVRHTPTPTSTSTVAATSPDTTKQSTTEDSKASKTAPGRRSAAPENTRYAKGDDGSKGFKKKVKTVEVKNPNANKFAALLDAD